MECNSYYRKGERKGKRDFCITPSPSPPPPRSGVIHTACILIAAIARNAFFFPLSLFPSHKRRRCTCVLTHSRGNMNSNAEGMYIYVHARRRGESSSFQSKSSRKYDAVICDRAARTAHSLCTARVYKESARNFQPAANASPAPPLPHISLCTTTFCPKILKFLGHIPDSCFFLFHGKKYIIYTVYSVFNIRSEYRPLYTRIFCYHPL